MQHYGFPTRLLDWTDSALIALYFAIKDKRRSDAAVWILDPRWLNKLSISTLSIASPTWKQVVPYLPRISATATLPQLPVAIDPVHATRRLSAQRGHFTIHGSDPRSLDRIANGRVRVKKLVIPRTSCERIEYELAVCGVVDTLLFPDLDGLSRELVRDLML
jgi:hypothetical protein